MLLLLYFNLCSLSLSPAAAGLPTCTGKYIIPLFINHDINKMAGRLVLKTKNTHKAAAFYKVSFTHTKLLTSEYHTPTKTKSLIQTNLLTN